jgi:hypothetical protein
MKKIPLSAWLFVLSSSLMGQGMWLPQRLDQQADAMSAQGMTMSTEAVYHESNASLKDAIVHFGGFCTGEVISNQGLVLTNHHCGYGAIQKHTTLENNYLKDGFWAETLADEMPNEGLFVDFVVFMKDIVIKDGDNAQAIMQAAHDEAKQAHPDLKIEVRDIYQGHQFMLVATKRYHDIRLVGAPPSLVGKFGADTDNWVFPRHNGDFSLFRIYADANGEPAAYHEDNVPLISPGHLTLSVAGAVDGDFSLIYGFPGSTTSYLPAAEVAMQLNDILPARIAMRDAVLSVWDSAMRIDEQVKIDYASKFASVSNGWKKWRGQIEGMERVHGMDSLVKKQLHVLRENPAAAERLLMALEPHLDSLSEGKLAMTYFGEFLRHWELGKWSRLVQALNKAINAGEGEAAAWQALVSFNANFDPELDRRMGKQLLATWAAVEDGGMSLPVKQYFKETSAFVGGIFSTESYASLPKVNQAVYDSLEVIAYLVDAMSHALVGIWPDMIAQYRTLSTSFASHSKAYQDAYRDWIADHMLANPTMAPDANSTLRVAYGKVLSLSPSDGVTYQTHTTANGLLQKYTPGDYEFDLPADFLSLLESRNYGDYANADGELPVCFIAANHTSGGNSGSPAFNAKGELIGLNFDRIWEGTMSDFYFTPERCRNIMVDIRYVLWVVDVYAGAERLIQEMHIVD